MGENTEDCEREGYANANKEKLAASAALGSQIHEDRTEAGEAVCSKQGEQEYDNIAVIIIKTMTRDTPKDESLPVNNISILSFPSFYRNTIA